MSDHELLGSEVALVRRILKGETGLYYQLIRRYRRMIYATAFSMATPIRHRRISGLAILCRSADDGCSSKMTTLQAEIMNKLRQAASMKYSGQ